MVVFWLLLPIQNTHLRNSSHCSCVLGRWFLFLFFYPQLSYNCADRTLLVNREDTEFSFFNQYSKIVQIVPYVFIVEKLEKKLNYHRFQHPVLFTFWFVSFCTSLHGNTHNTPHTWDCFVICFPHLPTYWECSPVSISTSLFSMPGIPVCTNLCSSPYPGCSGCNLSLL